MDEHEIPEYIFPILDGLPSKYTKTIEFWVLPSDLTHDIISTKEDIYNHFGHVGFSFDHKSINNSEKKILGFGPETMPKKGIWFNIFRGCCGGRVTNDTDIFRNILTKNPERTAYLIRFPVTDDIYLQFINFDLDGYPSETYGLPKYGYENCFSYPLKYLIPISYTGGDEIETTGYSYVHNFGGRLDYFVRFFKNEYDTKKIKYNEESRSLDEV